MLPSNRTTAAWVVSAGTNPRRGSVACLLRLVAWLLAVLAPVQGWAQLAEAKEHEIKAGFLIAFTRSVTWPTNLPAQGSNSIVIGILGTDPFGAFLDAAAQAGRAERPIEIRRIKTPEEAVLCHIVFISKAEARNEAKWLEALRGKPTLTVGESGKTIERGGMVEFVIVADNVRHNVNWPATQESGLKLKQPMLKHAHEVVHPPSTR